MQSHLISSGLNFTFYVSSNSASVLFIVANCSTYLVVEFPDSGRFKPDVWEQSNRGHQIDLHLLKIPYIVYGCENCSVSQKCVFPRPSKFLFLSSNCVIFQVMTSKPSSQTHKNFWSGSIKLGPHFCGTWDPPTKTGTPIF